MSLSFNLKRDARFGRSSDVDEHGGRGHDASSSRRDPKAVAGEPKPTRSLTLSPKRLVLLPILRHIQPRLVLTGRYKFLNFDFARRAPVGRGERGSGARVSMSYSIDVSTLFKLAQSLINTPFVLAGVIMCVKALFERVQRERALVEQFELANEAGDNSQVESAVPGDTGIEQALTISIPINEPKTGDEHDDDANDSRSDSSISLWESDWSFCSDEDNKRGSE